MIRMADEGEGMMKSAKGRMLTCFRCISPKLEPAGTKGCDEELGIAMFGWPENYETSFIILRKS